MKTNLSHGYRRALLCAFSVLLYVGVSSIGVASGNIWYDKYVAWDNAHGNSYYTGTDSGNLGWGESYLLRGYIMMYQMTKSTAWLDKFVTHVDYMTVQGHSGLTLDADGFLTWRSSAYGDGGSYPYLVHQGLIGVAMAQFVKLVHDTPALQGGTYSTKASTYQAFVEDQIVARWVSGGSYITGTTFVSASSTEAFYKEPTFGSGGDSLPGGLFSPLPYNQYLVFAEMLYLMHDVNGNASYLDHASRCVQYWTNRMPVNGNGYSWKYANVAFDANIEDTSHANLEIDAAIEAYHRGSILSGSQMAGLTFTLTENMWNGSTSAPLLSDRVDGTGTSGAKSKSVSAWTRLAEFSSTPWVIAANQFRTYTPVLCGDEFVLVQIMAWDPQKIVNQGFEYASYSDSTLPARWTRGQGTSTTVKRDTSDHFEGSACATIVSAANGAWQQMYQTWDEWQPSTSYTVNFAVKSTGTAGARIFMYNATTGTVVGSVHSYTNTSWATQSFTFTTPAAGPTLKLYLENNAPSAAGSASFDNVVIKVTGDSW